MPCRVLNGVSRTTIILNYYNVSYQASGPLHTVNLPRSVISQYPFPTPLPLRTRTSLWWFMVIMQMQHKALEINANPRQFPSSLEDGCNCSQCFLQSCYCNTRDNAKSLGQTIKDSLELVYWSLMEACLIIFLHSLGANWLKRQPAHGFILVLIPRE